MSTPVSTISKTTPVSDTPGPRKTETLPRGGWTSSLSAKIVFLAVVFVLVPVFLYLEFRRAYQESQELLLSSVRAEGLAISQSLLPLLETIDTAALPDLGRHLVPFASEVTTIKLLLRPAGINARSDAFYYLASWPAVTQSNLQAEHDTLAKQGVLERLGENCSGEMPFPLIYHRPTGGAEIVTAVTPLSTQLRCWEVVASFSEDAFPSAHLGQPYSAWPPPGTCERALAASVLPSRYVERSLKADRQQPFQRA
jgi:two-component system sensor histidine kinase ChvG